ncbi:hypothetical protein [Sporomusa sphaeroides]|uniref:Uncharacterized protein n=1 Tax=Sporomusa sphaeroides DSM 2875 TaxID=1337886 RepID=A0ABP2C539_9FIRM|nr:hypothetical protein [Sporomusa sphaeroides]OLS56379.1 hypothetical protein SPSPH_27720 [Sporomusa sphaeroides DSM 2875]CVK18474.1 hypothetical protein SSPH_01112 [Sporomusa sphaeroides DSM 2875]
MEWSELYLKWADIVIRLFQVIASWPIAISVIAIIFMRNHKDAIKDLLDRLLEGNGLGLSFRFKDTTPDIIEEVAKTEEKADSKQAEVDKLIQELITKSKLNEQDAEKYRIALSTANKELTNLKVKYSELQNQLETAVLHQQLSVMSNQHLNIFKMLVRSFGRENLNLSINSARNCKKIEEQLSKMLTSPSLRTKLIEMGIVNKEGLLTENGLKQLKIIAQQYPTI